MAKLLARAEMIEVLRSALKTVGNAEALRDGAPEAELLALQLDGFFASPENLSRIVAAIKAGFARKGGQVLLGPANITSSATFNDLLIAVAKRQG